MRSLVCQPSARSCLPSLERISAAKNATRRPQRVVRASMTTVSPTLAGLMNLVGEKSQNEYNCKIINSSWY